MFGDIFLANWQHLADVEALLQKVAAKKNSLIEVLLEFPTKKGQPSLHNRSSIRIEQLNKLDQSIGDSEAF